MELVEPTTTSTLSTFSLKSAKVMGMQPVLNCGLKGGIKVIEQLLEAVDHTTGDVGVVDGPCSNGEPPFDRIEGTCDLCIMAVYFEIASS